MIVVGIVGSPAGGKSTAAGILAEQGGTWINADLVAREVLETEDVHSQLSVYFGQEILGDGGRIDRSKMASLVFGDDDRSRGHLRYLESVIHPRTRQLITSRLRQAFKSNPNGAVVVLDIPLLFEAGWDLWCDEIVCVDASEAIRLDRTRARGWDDGEVRRREKNQWSIVEKKRLSTKVFTNDGELGSLRAELVVWYTELSSRVVDSTIPSNHLDC